MYEIIFSDRARKQFLKLEKSIQKRVTSSLEKIRIRPEAFVVKLVGDPAYKLRVGDYRILMDIDKGKLLILVLKVAHRREAYKEF